MMTFKSYIVEAMKRRYDFSSTQVNLPDDLAAAVTAWGQQNIPDPDVYRDPHDPGFGRENEPHVTILYGLYDTKPDKVRKVLEEHKSFDAKLGKVSLFTSNDRFDVVKIDVISKGLFELNKILRSSFDYHNNFPVYQPHVTIAYVKKGKGKPHDGEGFFKGKTFPVKEVTFSSKNGTKTVLTLRRAAKP